MVIRGRGGVSLWESPSSVKSIEGGISTSVVALKKGYESVLGGTRPVILEENMVEVGNVAVLEYKIFSFMVVPSQRNSVAQR